MFIIKLIFSQVLYLSKFYSRKGLYSFLQNQLDQLKVLGHVKVLNVGAGGEISTRLKILTNANIISIDVDEKRKPDFVMDVTNLKFEDNIFDAVFLIEVLEHVQNPKMAIDEIFRVLKPGGKLILSTPFIFGIHDQPFDFFRFTKYGLFLLLRDYVDVQVSERNSYIEAVLVLLIRLLMADKLTDRFIGLLFLFAAIIISPLLMLFSFIIQSNNVTTGYVSSGIKPTGSSKKI